LGAHADRGDGGRSRAGGLAGRPLPGVRPPDGQRQARHMGDLVRRSAVTAAAALAVVAGACGDPIVMIGDQLGIMRLVAGVPGATSGPPDTLATATVLNAPRAVRIDDGGVL